MQTLRIKAKLQNHGLARTVVSSQTMKESLSLRSEIQDPITITPGGERASWADATGETFEAVGSSMRSGLFSVAASLRAAVKGAIGGEREVVLAGDAYAVDSKIAEGSFAEVFLVRKRSTAEEYALKWIIAQDKEQLIDARREIEVHEKLRASEHILQLLATAEAQPSTRSASKKGCGCAAPLPLSKVGSIFHLIEGAESRPQKPWPLLETILASIMKDVCQGVAWMHENGLRHQDIKPHNILLFHDPAGPGGFARSSWTLAALVH